jgi:arylsulfatase A-like enzyme
LAQGGSLFFFDLAPAQRKYGFMRRFVAVVCVALYFPFLVSAAGRAEHIVVVVWDGLRPDSITKEHTPTLHQMVQDGVMFQNHHSSFCTATEVNGTAIATGAYPEKSGIIANRIYLPAINPFRAVDTQLTEIVRKGDEVMGGHYIPMPTVAETLQAAGMRTAIAGTKQVVLLHDRRDRTMNSMKGIVLFEGKTLPPSAIKPINELLGEFPPGVRSGSTSANEPRDQWTTSALLGPLWSNGVPAFSLLWLSEPDSSQHAAGPGSAKAFAALASSDRKLKEILSDLDRRKLRDKTDVFVVSDHGFSTVEKAVDVEDVLKKAGFSAQRVFQSPPKAGDIVIASQGGAVLFYIHGRDSELALKLVRFLQQQEFAGVLLAREAISGTFTLDQALFSSAHPPDVVMSMRWSDGKSKTGVPGLFYSDGGRAPGGGSHASLSRFDLHNTLVGAGPDLKKGFLNPMPSGNVDLAPTILWLLGVKPLVAMDGRVLSEALTINGPPASEPTIRRLEAQHVHDQFIWRQYLQISEVNRTLYLDEGNAWTETKTTAPRSP